MIVCVCAHAYAYVRVVCVHVCCACYVCVCMRVPAHAIMWCVEVREQHLEPVLSSYCVGPGSKIRLSGFGGTCLYLLSHLSLMCFYKIRKLVIMNR